MLKKFPSFLEPKLLFTIDLKFIDELNSEEISDSIKKEFKEKRHSLYPDATLHVIDIGNKWKLQDRKTQYILEATFNQIKVSKKEYITNFFWTLSLFNKLIIIALLSIAGIAIIFFCHLFLRICIWLETKMLNWEDINIGIVSASMVVIAIAFLVYSVWQNTKALSMQRHELKLTREEMKAQQKEMEEANNQRSVCEILANIRLLSQSKIDGDILKNPEKDPNYLIALLNISNLIQAACPILAKMTTFVIDGENLNRQFLHKFILNVIASNKDRLRGVELQWAKLQGVDLQGAYLSGAYLQWTNLQGAYLQWARLQEASLQGANLQGSKLQGADLQGANLQGANLQGANLQGANLQSADLQGANLRGGNLQGINLRLANLHGANLQGADLHGANLRESDLQGTNLQETNLQETNLQGTNLQGANLNQAEVTVEQFYHCTNLNQVQGLAKETMVAIKKQKPKLMTWWSENEKK